MLSRHKLVPLAAAAAAFFATQANALEFHGYLRSGIGWSNQNGGATCVTLPGVQGNGNFRLGNECTTYSELQFDQNVYDGKDGVKFDYHAMLGLQAQQQQDFENIAQNGQQVALRQNWVEAKNLPFLSGGSAWIGKRYYQRHDDHITDFFYWDASGPGAGIEHIKLGMGDANASFAIFRNNGFNGSPGPQLGIAANLANSATTRFDFRVAGIGLGPAGSLEVGVQFNAKDTNVAGATNGTGVTAEWSMPLLGGMNKLFATHGTGSINSPAIAYPNNTPGNQDGSWGIQDQLVWQVGSSFDGMLLAGHWDFKNNYKWDYLGARPVWHFNDYFKLQAELGTNAIKPNDGSGTRTLTKFAIAPTIVAGRGFWSRPELRFYYAYNKWNSNANNLWGGVTSGGPANNPFGTNDHGSNYGFQVEAWW